jgi:hypothetical protein
MPAHALTAKTKKQMPANDTANPSLFARSKSAIVWRWFEYFIFYPLINNRNLRALPIVQARRVFAQMSCTFARIGRNLCLSHMPKLLRRNRISKNCRYICRFHLAPV